MGSAKDLMSDTKQNPSRSSTITRRRLMMGASATLGAAAVATALVGGGLAHEPLGSSPATPHDLRSTTAPMHVAKQVNDWPVCHGDLAATRAARNSPINADNLGRLTVAWTKPITASGNLSGITANAVIIDQAIYLQDMQGNVVALERETGREFWRRDVNVPSVDPNGVAVAYGRVYAVTSETSMVFAVDQKTGELLWKVRLSNNDFECIRMTPLVYDNTVYVSTNPNNAAPGNVGGRARGILFALDAETGATLWSFDTAVEHPWGNPRANSGGGLSYPPSVDEAGNIYFGTGNAGPYSGINEYAHLSSRPSPNGFVASMVSLNGTTGDVRWAVNANPDGTFDHDFQHTPVLATVTFNGSPTQIAVGAGRTGTVIAANARTGEVIWKTRISRHENAATESDMEWVPKGTTPAFSGGLGGVESPLAFGDNKIFVPYIHFPSHVMPHNVDRTISSAITQATGGIAAIDAVTGDVVWDAKVNAPVVSGATVINDVVLSGSLDGYLRAYDIKTGDRLWEFEAPGGLNAPLAVAGDMIVFAAGGPIFVATPSGGTPASNRQSKPAIVALKLGS